jgi:chorismate-pyruvate lyase
MSHCAGAAALSHCKRSIVLQVADFAAPFFPSLAALGEFAPVASGEMPPDYRALLAHDDHMTVTVEAFHDCRVEVRVLQEHRDGDLYSRSSLLVCESTAKVVQFGIMRIHLGGLAHPVRLDIEGGKTPLGRALIRHNVLRHVELVQLWRVQPVPWLRDQLKLALGEPLFGRTARIVVERRPAVELLEIPRSVNGAVERD